MDDKTGIKLGMQELGRRSVDEFKNSRKLPIIIVLDNIRSLHNIGSVFRTSDAFSIEQVILTGITAKPPHREIQKTALGATESVEWTYSEDCVDVISDLKDRGVKVYGVEQVHGSKKLNELRVDFNREKIALVFGNEVKGVEQSVLNRCHDFIEIPQYGTKHSLNISVTVGVVLWELVRNLEK